jgi:hypothetical protein
MPATSLLFGSELLIMKATDKKSFQTSEMKFLRNVVDYRIDLNKMAK